MDLLTEVAWHIFVAWFAVTLLLAGLTLTLLGIGSVLVAAARRAGWWPRGGSHADRR